MVTRLIFVRVPESTMADAGQPVPQEEDRLMGTPEQLLAARRRFQEIGVEHMALQFMVPRWSERIEQIERCAREATPALRGAR